MAGNRTLKLSILGDVDNLKKSLDAGSKDVQSFGDKVSDFGKKAGVAFAVAGAAAVAYAGKLAVDGVKSAIEDEAAQAKLANTLKNVTKATDAQIKSTEEYILQTSLATGVGDEQLRPSLDRLTRATKDLDKAQKLQTLALDIAAGSGKSLQQVTEALSKAQEGNLAGLGRLGVGIDKAELKTLSFDQITAKLAGTFENQASKQADTFQGKLSRLQVAFDEGKETVGSYILTAITPLIETLVQKVIPAIADFTSNLGEKLRPVIEFLTPITDGLRKAFNSVRDSFAENQDELKPLFALFKGIAEFARDVLAPIISKVLGKAFEILGKAIGGLIDGLASVVSFFDNLYSKIKRVIDISKQIGGALNPFDNASYSTGASVPTTGGMSATQMVNNQITINGAIDPVSTARQIATVLNSEATTSGTFNSLGISRAVAMS
jgi:microcompartment protein CcmL/EutN